MTLAEVQEELADVNAQLKAIKDGAQAYGTSGNNLTRANYKDLIARKKELVALEAKLSNPGGRIRYPIFATRS